MKVSPLGSRRAEQEETGRQEVLDKSKNVSYSVIRVQKVPCFDKFGKVDLDFRSFLVPYGQNRKAFCLNQVKKRT